MLNYKKINTLPYAYDEDFSHSHFNVYLKNYGDYKLYRTPDLLYVINCDIERIYASYNLDEAINYLSIVTDIRESDVINYKESNKENHATRIYACQVGGYFDIRAYTEINTETKKSRFTITQMSKIWDGTDFVWNHENIFSSYNVDETISFFNTKKLELTNYVKENKLDYTTIIDSIICDKVLDISPNIYHEYYYTIFTTYLETIHHKKMVYINGELCYCSVMRKIYITDYFKNKMMIDNLTFENYFGAFMEYNFMNIYSELNESVINNLKSKFTELYLTI